MELLFFHYQFNLNGEVKHVIGTGPDWPHPDISLSYSEVVIKKCYA
jgi:hypothetical protein